MLYRFLNQDRFPWFTTLSILTSLTATSIIVGLQSSPPVGIEGMVAGIFLRLLWIIVPGLSLVWGLFAMIRREYCGGRIALAGIVIPLAILGRIEYLDEQRLSAEERASTWDTIQDVFVLPDGRLLLFGSGLIRLFADGQPDPSFHRDSSFAHGGGLPRRIRLHSVPVCAAMTPDGDLILATRGWIGRVRPDGSDAPDLLSGLNEDACWGMAVQPDGKVLVAWDSSPRKPIERLLPDGAVDSGFHSNLAFAEPHDTFPLFDLPKLAVLPNGKILIMGPIEQMDHACVFSWVRLNADGSRDESFQARSSCPPADWIRVGAPDWFTVLPDGSLIFHSWYLNSDWTREGRTFHLDPDGNEIPGPIKGDAGLDPNLKDVAVTRDGRILLAAADWFRTIRPDGKLDRSLEKIYEPLSERRIILQGEKILILGDHGELIRLTSDGSLDASFKIPPLKVYSD